MWGRHFKSWLLWSVWSMNIHENTVCRNGWSLRQWHSETIVWRKRQMATFLTVHSQLWQFCGISSFLVSWNSWSNRQEGFWCKKKLWASRIKSTSQVPPTFQMMHFQFFISCLIFWGDGSYFWCLLVRLNSLRTIKPFSFVCHVGTWQTFKADMVSSY